MHISIIRWAMKPQIDLKPLDVERRTRLEDLFILAKTNLAEFVRYKPTIISTMADYMRDGYDITRYWHAFRMTSYQYRGGK